MKGIVLVGGYGRRLYPMTVATPKGLMPLYDKPMVYYPLSTLMLAGIKDILVIAAPEVENHFKTLLGDGSRFGISLQYKPQPEPKGIADAFIIGEEFISNGPIALALGDNIFHGEGLPELVQQTRTAFENGQKGATVFGYAVHDPERFGVVEITPEGKALSLVEKPKNPKSNLAVTGLYFYDNSVVEIAKNVVPSARGELEITDVNNAYLQKNELTVQTLGTDFIWFDTGTPASLLEAANTIEKLQKKTGRKIGCLEEVGYHKKWLQRSDIETQLKSIGSSDYSAYLCTIISE